MKPLVSVCIPVWNSERYLDECLESVFAQNFDSLEIVVANDASPGRSNDGRTCKKIVRQAQKRHRTKIKYIEHSENRALVETRRSLASAASGEFIFMLDSDDVLEPDAVSFLWSLEELHKTDIVHGGFKVFPESAEGRQKFPLFDGFIPGSGLLDAWIVRREYTSFLWAKLIRRSVFCAAMEKIPYTYCNMAEDFLIWFFITQTAASYFGTSRPIYRYRRDSGMSSEKKITTIEQCAQICSAASVFTNIFMYIDELSQRGDCRFTDEQLYAIGKSAEHYVKSGVAQIKQSASPELVPQAIQLIKENWGEELVDRLVPECALPGESKMTS